MQGIVSVMVDHHRRVATAARPWVQCMLCRLKRHHLDALPSTFKHRLVHLPHKYVVKSETAPSLSPHHLVVLPALRVECAPSTPLSN